MHALIEHTRHAAIGDTPTLANAERFQLQRQRANYVIIHKRTAHTLAKLVIRKEKIVMVLEGNYHLIKYRVKK